jgi:hypothetical protein
MLLAGGPFATDSPNIPTELESLPLLRPLFALKLITLAQATRFPSHQVDGVLSDFTAFRSLPHLPPFLNA